MHAIMLQDWITIRSTSGTTIEQSSDEYADLGGYIDVQLMAEVKDYTGSSLVLRFTTSPTKDESLFYTMDSVGVAATGVTWKIVRFADSSTPLARWVRWTASDAAADWRLTFRVWMVARAA